MGKAALLFVAGFALLGVSYLSGAQQGMASTEMALAEHQYQVLARNAALAGFQRVRQRLTEDFYGAQSVNAPYESAAYDVHIQRAGAVATVTSVGTALMPDNRTVSYNVIAEIQRQVVPQISAEPPQFMQYALLTERDLSLGGDILTDLYVRGDANNTLNANVHTNGNLYIRGNSVEVYGFGSYVGYGAANPNSALLDSFRPYYNPTSAQTSARAPRVEIPPYDYPTFRDRALMAPVETPGDLALSGTYNLGSRDSVYVWHVNGNLSASGNVTINGYVLFLVEGDVSITGNVRAGTTGYDGADESNIALYTAGNVSFGGNATLFGQIFAEGNTTFLHGTPNIYGTVTTRGAADLRGTPNIYYRPASPALTAVFQEPEIRYRLLSYSEW